MFPDARRFYLNDHYYAALLVKNGDADGMVGGAADSYRNCVRPMICIILWPQTIGRGLHGGKERESGFADEISI